VRYRPERHERDEVRAALRGAAARAGGPLALAAAGTMFEFFSFVPTAYRGIAELPGRATLGQIDIQPIQIIALRWEGWRENRGGG
jgi:hypothetical protein